jgi:hemoglobin
LEIAGTKTGGTKTGGTKTSGAKTGGARTNGTRVEKTIYMKYGSRVTSGMAECMYDRVLEDPELAPFFDGVDIDRLREHVADFLSVLTGGPDIYRGRDLRAARASFSISKDHFERVMGHIAAAATELAIEPDDITTIATAIRGYEADVVSG